MALQPSPARGRQYCAVLGSFDLRELVMWCCAQALLSVQESTLRADFERMRADAKHQ